MKRFLRKQLTKLSRYLWDLVKEQALQEAERRIAREVVDRLQPGAPKPATPAQVPDEPERVDPLVEATIGAMWSDPRAASLARGQAKAMIAAGMKPHQVAERIANSGTVIE